LRSIRERLNSMQPETGSQNLPVDVGVPVGQVTAGADRKTARGNHFVIELPGADPTDGRFRQHSRLIPESLTGAYSRSQSLSAEHILFLDTETTGLDRGTGTHVFLVGIGYFAGDQFHVQQHFLRDLYEEASLLCELDNIVRNFPVLVTFNGRGFDWPLLTNRFILHGYRNIPELVHWDLLTSSRRVWRNRLRDCSLGSLERNILDVHRYGDVPGYLIPALYFDYLRSKDARPLRPIFSHNHEDIVSLARLADLILRTEQNPLIELSNPIDRVSYGMYLMNYGDPSLGERLIEPELQSHGIQSDLRFRAAKTLADNYKRSRHWSNVVEIWRAMLQHESHTPEQSLFPLVELAKVFEHRLKDHSQAIRYVERAMNLCELNSWTEPRNDLMHRLDRLHRRQRNLVRAGR
jgi:uncharacterized protein